MTTTTARQRQTSVSTRLGLRAARGVGGSAGHGGVRAAAARSRTARPPLSPGARAALVAFVPGTVLKAGSPELRDAELWKLVLEGGPDAPRFVRDLR